VPQLFVQSGAPMFADPTHFPWTIPGIPSYVTEARIYAKHILATRSDAKIAVFYQNDDFRKGHLKGLRDELGPDRANMIVKEGSYETSEPTVDSQVVTLQGSGADVFLIAATPKSAAQAILGPRLGGDPLSQLPSRSPSPPCLNPPASTSRKGSSAPPPPST
jgi:branched-chain amino acid transport system substrate-binding protein